MSNDKPLLERKTYFIKKSFQFRFILKFCLIILAGLLVSTGIFFLFSSTMDTLTSTFQGSRLVVKETSFAVLPSVIYTNLITLGLITVAAIVVTLLVSHKLAGPLFRFEKDLKEVGKGNLAKRVGLRKQDQLKDFVGSLNEMIDNLHTKVLDIRSEIAQITQLASRKNVPEEIIEELNHLNQEIDTKFQL